MGDESDSASREEYEPQGERSNWQRFTNWIECWWKGCHPPVNKVVGIHGDCVPKGRPASLRFVQELRGYPISDYFSYEAPSVEIHKFLDYKDLPSNFVWEVIGLSVFCPHCHDLKQTRSIKNAHYKEEYREMVQAHIPYFNTEEERVAAWMKFDLMEK